MLVSPQPAHREKSCSLPTVLLCKISKTPGMHTVRHVLELHTTLSPNIITKADMAACIKRTGSTPAVTCPMHTATQVQYSEQGNNTKYATLHNN